MGDDTFRYVFSDWDVFGQLTIDTAREVAYRFGTTPEVIKSYSQGQPWTTRAWTLFGHQVKEASINDGEILIIPRHGAEWPLDNGAVWAEWTPNPGDTLQMVVDELKKGSPIGALIPEDVGSFKVRDLIHYYYRNADLRRATLKASGTKYVGEDASNVYPDLKLDLSDVKTIWVPVHPPLVQGVPAACSPTDAPKTGATVDVKPNDDFRRLTSFLSNIENQLDVADMARGRVVRYDNEASQVRKSFADLKDSMEEKIKKWEGISQLAAANHMGDPNDAASKAARAEALDKIGALIAKANKQTLGQPVWQKYVPDGLDKIAAATTKLAGLIRNGDMIALLSSLCPLMYDAPLLNRSGKKTTLYDYMCNLAARATVAIANAPSAIDGFEAICAIADKCDPSKLAGSGCADLIEYAASSAYGFDANGLKAPSIKGHEVLGILATVRMVKDLQGAAGSGNAKKYATAGMKAALGKIMPLLVRLGIAQPSDPPGETVKKLKEALELYKTSKEAFESGSKARLLETYDQPGLIAFLKGFLHPFGGGDEEGMTRFIPAGMRGTFTVLSGLWEIAGSGAEAVEASDKAEEAGSTTAARLEQTASTEGALMSATAAVLEGAKSLKLFATDGSGELLAFGQNAELTLKVFGKAAFLLGAFVDGVEAYQDSQDGKRVEGVGHVLGAGGNLLLFLAVSIGGAPEFVVVGVVLLVGGAILTHGKFIIELIHGETVARFEAITKAPDGDSDKARKESALYLLVKRWSEDFGFAAELASFAESFEKADFSAFSVTGGYMAAQPPDLD